VVINFEFTIILEIEVKLIADIIIIFIDNNVFIITFSISLNDVIFNIAIDILRIEGTNKVVVIV